MFQPDAFDPYRAWLGIEAAVAGNSLYALLGVRRFEPNMTVIAIALAAQRAKLAGASVADFLAVASRIDAELRLAEHCLLNPAAKAEYDRRLRGERTERSRWRVSTTRKRTQESVNALPPMPAATETVGLQAELTSASLVAR